MKQPKTIPGPMGSFSKMENSIGSVIFEILSYRQNRLATFFNTRWYFVKFQNCLLLIKFYNKEIVYFAAWEYFVKGLITLHLHQHKLNLLTYMLHLIGAQQLYNLHICPSVGQPSQYYLDQSFQSKDNSQLDPSTLAFRAIPSP